MRGSPDGRMRPRATSPSGCGAPRDEVGEIVEAHPQADRRLRDAPLDRHLVHAVELQVPRLDVAEVPLDRRAARHLLAAGVAGEQVEEDPHRLRVAPDRAVALPEQAGAQQRSAQIAALARRDAHRKREVRDVVERQADGAQPRLVGARALLVEILEREAEALGVGRVPARRDRHAQRVLRDLADDVDDRVLGARGSAS